MRMRRPGRIELGSKMSHVAGNGIAEEFRCTMLLPEERNETRDPPSGGGGEEKSQES